MTEVASKGSPASTAAAATDNEPPCFQAPPPPLTSPPTPPPLPPMMMRATPEHNLARLRWHAAQYAMQQLQVEAEKLRDAVNALLRLLLLQ